MASKKLLKEAPSTVSPVWYSVTFCGYTEFC
jgi:hypothetical protein